MRTHPKKPESDDETPVFSQTALRLPENFLYTHADTVVAIVLFTLHMMHVTP